ncbi:16286_t:CDS:2, partial [Funneliformis geosporum]
REGVDDKCPYARDKRNEHKVNCMCFVKNLDMVSEQNNLIDQEQIINTRKETWDSLFLFPYQETKQKFTEYCQGLNNQVAGLIESYRAYFTEVEFRQVEGFKDLLRQLNTQPMFLTDREDELFASDSEKMLEGRINYGLAMRFFWKWTNLVAKNGVQAEE